MASSQTELLSQLPTPSSLPELSYRRLRGALRNELLPAVVVDLPRFDANVKAAAQLAAASGKKLRPASKSLRVPDLLRRVFGVGGPAVQGVMGPRSDQ